MFDVDALIEACISALDDPHPQLSARDVLARALERPDAVAERMRPARGGITMLHQAHDLTIIDVVWAPGMEIFAHDHRMWAVIGVYAGREDNTFYRRGPGSLTETNGKTLHAGEVAVLGAETIHAVANPLPRPTGAIHVYGGDFVNQPRSQWRPPDRDEEPYDAAAVALEFETANTRAGL
jgi:predicted metal-dependent enzyme (double-stranded beta helix superfamily)